jgi:hypothetical protein
MVRKGAACVSGTLRTRLLSLDEALVWIARLATIDLPNLMGSTSGYTIVVLSKEQMELE